MAWLIPALLLLAVAGARFQDWALVWLGLAPALVLAVGAALYAESNER